MPSECCPKGWKRGLCSVLTDTRVFGIQSRHGHVRQRVFCSVIGCRGDPRARTRRHDGKGMQKGFPSWRTLTTPRRDARGVSSSLAHLSTAFSPSPPENRWLNPYHAQDHTSAHMLSLHYRYPFFPSRALWLFRTCVGGDSRACEHTRATGNDVPARDFGLQ